MVGGIFGGGVAARRFHDREILAQEVLACRPEPSFACRFRPSQKRKRCSRASVGEPCLAFLEDWERAARGGGQPIKSLGSRTQVINEPLVTIEAGDDERGDDEAGQARNEVEVGRAARLSNLRMIADASAAGSWRPVTAARWTSA